MRGVVFGTSGAAISDRAAVLAQQLSPAIHDGRRYTTFIGNHEVLLRGHPLFTSGLTRLTGGFGNEQEFRSVLSDAEVQTAYSDLNAAAFKPGWTVFSKPSRAAMPAATLLRGFVESFLSSIQRQIRPVLRVLGQADGMGWSLLEVRRTQEHRFRGRPYDVPAKFRQHFTENFWVSRDETRLVFQDTTGVQDFPMPDGDRFISASQGLADPYGSEATGGKLWYLWQLKKTYEEWQARGVRQSIGGTPLFRFKGEIAPGATETEVQAAVNLLRLELAGVAQLQEEFGFTVLLGDLEYQDVIPAGKVSDWSSLIDRLNAQMRRLVTGETLTAQSEDGGGNRAAGDGAQVKLNARAGEYADLAQSAFVEDVILATIRANFPDVDPDDVPRWLLRSLFPISIEYVNAVSSWKGAALDRDQIYEAWNLPAPHEGTVNALTAAGPAQAGAPGGDPLAQTPDPRGLPGTGTVEGPQLSRLPARATALRARADAVLQADAEAIEAGALAIEEQGAEALERALATRMQILRDAVREADPETGRPLPLAP